MFGKIAKYLSLFLLFTLIAAGGYLFYRLNKAIPSYEGELTLKILEAPVRVELDHWGIPHIQAESELDARRALGYLMARERLFQMDLYRLAAKGELSKLIGPDTIELDRLYRVLGLRRASERWLQEGVVSAEVLTAMNAFFDGVNAFAAEGNLPFEYLLLGHTPEKFTAVDALSFVGYMAYSFNVPARQDLLMPQLELKYGKDKVERLRGETNKLKKMTAQIAPAFQLNEKIAKHLAKIEDLHDQIGRIEGSNAWVLSGDRTQSASPILASDPHISFTLPNLWFEAHLQFDRAGERVDEYGHFLPLVAVPVMAHNHKYGWGLTMSFIDDMDFYQEKFSDDRTQVLYQNEWHELSYIKEVIEIKGAPSEELEIAITPHGPIVDSVFETKDVSAWWAFTDADNKAIDAFYRMGRAQNAQEFARAVSLGGAPGMNVLYADKDGHIGWWMLGQVPLRPFGVRSDFMGRGDDGSFDLLGKLPFAAKPHQFDPPTGVIVSANQRPPGSDVSIIGDYQTPDRYNTIGSLLDQKQKWSVEELKKVQTMPFNIEEDWKRKLIISDVRNAQGDIEFPELLEEVESWNGMSEVQMRAPLLYHHWMFVIERLLLDEFNKDEFLGFCRLNAEMKVVARMLENGEDSWWDLAETKDKIETRTDIVALAWTQALSELRDELGADTSKWTWGQMHGLPFVHPLGRKGVLSNILTYGPYPASGGFNNVNNLRRIGCGENHIIRAGPSTRRLVDFSESTISQGVLPLGNSGHLLSPYFKNQLPLYLKGEYRNQEMTFKSERKYLILRPN